MFRRFWRDVILGTIFILGLMGLLASATAFKVFDIFDPIGDALGDMQFTDIYFSRLLDDPTADTRVVLVNVGLESRAGISILIDSISKHQPAAIGVDLFFRRQHQDTLGDLMLMDALGRVENLVLVTKLNQTLYNEDLDEYDTVEWSHPMFTWNAQPAFANLITDADVQEDLKMCREFTPQLMTADGENNLAFAVKLASYLAPENAEEFLARGNEVEVINYRGNVIDFGATRFGNKYYALDVNDVFYGNFTADIIRDNIIIFCFLGEELGDRENFEDKFFTPLNETYVGRAFPDMYGGVIHANIVSMILNNDYIFYLKDWQKWLVMILGLFMNIMMFSWIYKKLPKWYDGITKVIQLIEFVGIIYIMVYMMDLFSLKLDLTLLLFAVAISGDGLEVFYGVVKNSLSREGRKELFKVSRL